jgi:hypothetical protein
LARIVEREMIEENQAKNPGKGSLKKPSVEDVIKRMNVRDGEKVTGGKRVLGDIVRDGLGRARPHSRSGDYVQKSGKLSAKNEQDRREIVDIARDYMREVRAKRNKYPRMSEIVGHFRDKERDGKTVTGDTELLWNLAREAIALGEPRHEESEAPAESGDTGAHGESATRGQGKRTADSENAGSSAGSSRHKRVRTDVAGTAREVGPGRRMYEPTGRQLDALPAGVRALRTDPNGDCLFEAVLRSAPELGALFPTSRDLRIAAVAEMALNSDRYLPFYHGDDDYNVAVGALGRTGEYMTDAADLLPVAIAAVTGLSVRVLGEDGQPAQDPFGGSGGRQITLLRVNDAGGHYLGTGPVERGDGRVGPSQRPASAPSRGQVEVGHAPPRNSDDDAMSVSSSDGSFQHEGAWKYDWGLGEQSSHETPLPSEVDARRGIARAIGSALSHDDTPELFGHLHRNGPEPRAVQALEHAFAAEHRNMTLAHVLTTAREDGRIGAADYEHALHLLGYRQTMFADRAEDVRVASTAGPYPSANYSVQGVAMSLRGHIELGHSDETLNVLAGLNRDVRATWAVHDAYHDMFGSSLLGDLNTRMPAEYRAFLNHLLGDISEHAVPEYLARQWFAELEHATFDHEEYGELPVPTGYAEEGCFLRAHLWALRLRQLGAPVHKIFVARADPPLSTWSQTAAGATREIPVEVVWRYHVAPAVRVAGAGGERWTVFDPVMRPGLLTPHEWMSRAGVDNPPEPTHDTLPEIRRLLAEHSANHPEEWTAPAPGNPRLPLQTVSVITDMHAYGFPHPDNGVFDDIRDVDSHVRQAEDLLTQHALIDLDRRLRRGVQEILDRHLSPEDTLAALHELAYDNPQSLGFSERPENHAHLERLLALLWQHHDELQGIFPMVEGAYLHWLARAMDVDADSSGHPASLHPSAHVDHDGRTAVTVIAGGGHWNVFGEPTPEQSAAIAHELAEAARQNWTYGGREVAGEPVPLADRNRTLALVRHIIGEVERGGPDADAASTIARLAQGHERPEIVSAAVHKYFEPHSADTRPAPVRTDTTARGAHDYDPSRHDSTKSVVDDESWRHSRERSASWFKPDRPFRPDQWEHLRRDDLVRTVRTEIADVRTSTRLDESGRPRDGQGRSGFERYTGLVRYDVRRIEVESGRFVREHTVKLHLSGDAEQVAQAKRDAVAAVNSLLNKGYRLPSGDQFHVRLEFPDVVGDAHASVEVGGKSTDQTHWRPGEDPKVLAHEVLHYLGPGDEYRDEGRVFLDKARKSAVVADGGLLGARVRRGDVELKPRNLWFVERVARDQVEVPETRLDVNYDGLKLGQVNPRMQDVVGGPVRPRDSDDDAMSVGSSDGSFHHEDVREHDWGLGEQSSDGAPPPWEVDARRGIARAVGGALTREGGSVELFRHLHRNGVESESVRALEHAFLSERGGESLPDALSGAREGGRLSDAQYEQVLQLLGYRQTMFADPAHDLRVTTTAGPSPSSHASVRMLAIALRQNLQLGRHDEVLTLLGGVDRDVRAIWAVNDAYLDMYSSQLKDDLETGLPVEHRAYVDHLLGEVSAQAVPEHVARQWFAELEHATFEHEEHGVLPVPIGFPEEGCYLRAHMWALRLRQLGAPVRKIFVAQADPLLEMLSDTAEGATREHPVKVSWEYHVAPVVWVRKQTGDDGWMVFDPVMRSGLLTPQEWAARAGAEWEPNVFEGSLREMHQSMREDMADDPGSWTDSGPVRYPLDVLSFITDAHALDFPYAESAVYGSLRDADREARTEDDTLAEHSFADMERELQRGVREVLDRELSPDETLQELRRLADGNRRSEGFLSRPENRPHMERLLGALPYGHYTELLDIFPSLSNGDQGPHATVIETRPAPDEDDQALYELVDEAPWAHELADAHEHPELYFTAEAEHLLTYDELLERPGEQGSAIPLGKIDQARANAPVNRVRGPVEYDVRRMEITPGEWVHEATVHLFLRDEHGVLSEGDLLGRYRDVLEGVEDRFNQAYLLPGGDQFRLNVVQVADEADAHAVFRIADDGEQPRELADRVGDLLGLSAHHGMTVGHLAELESRRGTLREAEYDENRDDRHPWQVGADLRGQQRWFHADEVMSMPLVDDQGRRFGTTFVQTRLEQAFDARWASAERRDRSVLFQSEVKGGSEAYHVLIF